MMLMSCRGTNSNDSANQPSSRGFYNSRQAKADQNKNPAYGIPAPQHDREEVILRRKGYTTSYNKDTRCPYWVAWHLTSAHTNGKHQRGRETFTEDTDVTPRATDADYYSSRYGRGHMCPAGDNKWDATAMRESFLFTNICPQNHNLNKYEWNTLEIQCREWARQYGAVDIVCGPLYSSTIPPRTIGRGHVRVPDGFFKVVMCRKGRPKAIGFMFKNDGKKVILEDCVCTVDEVEHLTGFDFFPALDDKTEQFIESEAHLSEWQKSKTIQYTYFRCGLR